MGAATRSFQMSFAAGAATLCEGSSASLDRFAAGYGQWRCGGGLCVVESARCDGKVDCYDGTDEVNCSKPEVSAGAGSDPDYADAAELCNVSDLDILPGTSRGDVWRCNGGRCVPLAARCNGIVNCYDASDEAGCDSLVSESDPAGALTVQHQLVKDQPEFGTASPSASGMGSRPPVSFAYVAVAEDCSDEYRHTSPGNFSDDFRKWRCGRGRCIDASGRCNGVPNCLDGSDEDACNTDMPLSVNSSGGAECWDALRNMATASLIVTNVLECGARGQAAKSVAGLPGHGPGAEVICVPDVCDAGPDALSWALRRFVGRGWPHVLWTIAAPGPCASAMVNAGHRYIAKWIIGHPSQGDLGACISEDNGKFMTVRGWDEVDDIQRRIFLPIPSIDRALNGGEQMLVQVCVPQQCSESEVQSEVVPYASALGALLLGRPELSSQVVAQKLAGAFPTFSLENLPPVEEMRPISEAHVDFAIIGSPKCGTTSLRSNLMTHPEIQFSSQFEDPWFWTWRRTREEIKRFELFYNKSHPEGKRVLRGVNDPVLVYQSQAVSTLSSLANVKVILLLRDPVDHLESWINFGHWPFFWGGQLHMQGMMAASVVRRNVHPWFSFQQTLVVPLEAFRYDAAGTYRKVTDFLGIDAFPPGHKFLKANDNQGRAFQRLNTCDPVRGINVRDSLNEFYSSEYSQLQTIMRDNGFGTVNDVRSGMTRVMMRPKGCGIPSSQLASHPLLRPSACPLNSVPQCFSSDFTCEKCCGGGGPPECWHPEVGVTREYCCTQGKQSGFEQAGRIIRQWLCGYDNNSCTIEVRTFHDAGPTVSSKVLVERYVVP